MTSRERLLGAIRGEPIDRVPISTYELVPCNPLAWENHEPSYRRLMDYAREHTDCMVMWNPPRARRVERPEAAGDDTFTDTGDLTGDASDTDVKTWREGSSTFTRTVIHTPKGDLTKVERRDDNLYTVWTLEHLCKDLDDVDRFMSIPYDFHGFDYSGLDEIRQATGEAGVILPSLVDPTAAVGTLMDPHEFLVSIVTEEKAFMRYVEMMHERLLIELRDLLEHNAGDLYRLCGPELATPPFLPLEAFRKWMTPFCKEMVDLVHEHGAYARIHCHGRIADILDELVKIGADALDPVEAPPSGDIELADVKRAIGDRICLMGNLQPRDMETLPVERVEEIVRDTMRAGKPGGRYVIMPTAAPLGVPLPPRAEENYLRFIDVALEEGRY